MTEVNVLPVLDVFVKVILFLFYLKVKVQLLNMNVKIICMLSQDPFHDKGVQCLSMSICAFVN